MRAAGADEKNHLRKIQGKYVLWCERRTHAPGVELSGLIDYQGF